MAEADWDPFADPADDPAAVAQAEEEARARAEAEEQTLEKPLPEEAELFPSAPDAGSLPLARASAVERRRQRDREELEAQIDFAGLLEAFPPPSLAPGELCVAHFVLDAEPADVVLELPRLDTEARASSGARIAPVVGGGLIAIWQDARAELLEIVPRQELERHGQRAVGGEACYSRAVVHTSAVLPVRMCDPLSAPQPEDVQSRKEHTYVELQDFCRFVPVAEGCGERTVMRRAFWGVEVTQDHGLPAIAFKEKLCNTFEAENRRWVAHWAPEALAAPPPPAPPLPAPEARVAASGQSRGSPPVLTLEEAIQLQDMLIAEYSKTEFQVKLHASWAAAGGDQVEQLKARREVCLPIQGPVVEMFGFEPTQKGVNQSVTAFKPFNDHPEVASRNMTMGYLVNPPQQDQEFIEGHLVASTQAASKLLYGALRLPELYKADKELVALAKDGATSRVRLSIEQNLSDPNILIPDKLGWINEARSRFYFIEERTPLIAAVEAGHLGVFDLLLGYQHLVDLNAVCFEWSITDCYKKYTALDLGQACEKNHAHAAAAVMVQRLRAAGGRPAEELPHPRRENPFLRWEEYFPDAKLYNIGTEHANSSYGDSGGVNYGADPDHGFGGWPGGSPEPPPSAGGPPPPPPPSSGNRGRGGGWRLPAMPKEGDPDLEAAVLKLRQRLLAAGDTTPEERQRFLRHLFLEWHPDKNPHAQELATKVFQWLQGVKDSSS